MNDFLMHYGIFGMKWGVRRYQNEDGTLTPEGRIRYGFYKDQRKEEDAVKDYNNYIGNNSDRIENLHKVSESLKSALSEKNKAYQSYYSDFKFDEKEKNEIFKVLDSWYGKPINNNGEDDALYNYEVRDLLYNTLQSKQPKQLAQIDRKYDDLVQRFYKESHNLTDNLVQQYSDVVVYSTKKGFLGLNVVDRRTDGSDFIRNLMSNSNIPLTSPIKGDEYNQVADKTLEKALDRLAKDFSVTRYNEHLKKQS